MTRPFSIGIVSFRALRAIGLTAALALLVPPALAAGRPLPPCDEDDQSGCDETLHDTEGGQRVVLCDEDDSSDCHDAVLDIRIPEIHIHKVMAGLNEALGEMDGTLAQIHLNGAAAAGKEAREAYTVAIQKLLESSGPHGFLGIAFTSLTPALREHFGVDREAGIMVSRVEEDSPAQEAGLEVGDILTAVDGRSIHSSFDLLRAIGDKKKDDQVEIELVRDGRTMTVTATLTERQRFRYDVGPLFWSVNEDEDEGGGNADHRLDFRFKFAPESLRGALKNLQSLYSDDQWRERFQQEEKRSKEIEEKMEALEKRLQELEGEIDRRNRR